MLTAPFPGSNSYLLTSRFAAAEAPEAAEVLAQAHSVGDTMATEHYQLFSTHLWTQYVLLQQDTISWDQPLLSVHTACAWNAVFPTAARAGHGTALVAELAQYVHQCAGALLALVHHCCRQGTAAQPHVCPPRPRTWHTYVHHGCHRECAQRHPASSVAMSHTQTGASACTCHAVYPLLHCGQPVALQSSYQPDGSEQESSGYVCLSAITPEATSANANSAAPADTSGAGATTADASQAAHQEGSDGSGLPVATLPDLVAFVAEHVLAQDAKLAREFAEHLLPLCAGDVAAALQGSSGAELQRGLQVRSVAFCSSAAQCCGMSPTAD